ncbi:MAG: hypothetical protein U0325_21955 [Polyangiales bacterium]
MAVDHHVGGAGVAQRRARRAKELYAAVNAGLVAITGRRGPASCAARRSSNVKPPPRRGHCRHRVIGIEA